MNSVAETLNKAADLIEERGWGGDWYAEKGDPICVEGALLETLGVDPDDRWAGVGEKFYGCPAYLAVTDYLGGVLMNRVDSLWCWNDAPYRTAEEVVDVLRMVALIEADRETDADAAAIVSAASRVPVTVVRAR